MESFTPLMRSRINDLEEGYDAYYLKFNVAPGEAYWIRYDLTKIHGKLHGELWFIYFKNKMPHIYLKKELPSEVKEDTIKIGNGELHDRNCFGEINGIKWNLSWTPLVDGFMYYGESFITRRIPTRASAPYPSVKVDGTITLNNQSLTVKSLPGEIGHHWGKYHQKMWFYYHGNAFDTPVMVIGAGSKRIGKLLNLMYYNDGTKTYGISSISSALRHGKGKINIDPKKSAIEALFEATFKQGTKVKFSISAPFSSIIGVTYNDPKGPVYCYNSMVADGELIIQDKDTKKLELPGGAAFEIGTREKIEGIKILL
ncbi:MAG: hypothetical protein QXL15_00765 [Candidatus Korarchaeota archaeon]